MVEFPRCFACVGDRRIVCDGQIQFARKILSDQQSMLDSMDSDEAREMLAATQASTSQMFINVHVNSIGCRLMPDDVLKLITDKEG